MGCPARLCAGLMLGMICTLGAGRAWAQQLSLDVEALRVESVGATWVGVDFLNTYTSAVVACTYNLPSRTNDAAIPRVRNVTATGMEVRAQLWEPTGSVTASAIHCLVVDEGVRTLDGGQVLEARRVLSTSTTGQAVGNWNTADYRNVTATFTQSFPNLVVIGQLMSANDAQPSTFTTRSSANRGTRPTSANFLVGKHIGQISGTRASETLGVIATSPGSGTSNDVAYLFGVTPNNVQGVGTNTPPWSNAVAGDFDTGVATQNAENGGQGGFAVLYGADPLPANRLDLAIDEETFAGDTTRSHIQEEVAYGLFRNAQTADVKATKTLATTAGSFAIPGADVTYMLSVRNDGSAPLARNGLFFTDPLPPEIEIFTGDLAGPGSGPVIFDAGGTSLTFASADIGYSTSATPPATFADCTAAANGSYDATITYLCLRPGGRLDGGTLASPGTASFTFRARIK